MLTRKQYSNIVATRLRVESGNANQEIQPMEPAVSEFMSQKLESITLHGIVNERWGNGGSP